MTRDEFEHVIKAAADIVDDELVVIGSQAVLAEFPDAPAALLTSSEVDLYPLNQPERADEIDGAIGDGSLFHATYAYYAHGVGPETPVAPAGWQERLVRLELSPHQRSKENVIAWCMSTTDLVLAKLAAGRPHDVEFAIEAVRGGLIDPTQLELGIDQLPETHRESTRARLVVVRSRV